MPASLLADLVLALHGAFVAFACLGGLLVLRWPRACWLHGPALAWGVAVMAFGWTCPLTPLEHALRRAAGDTVGAASFLDRTLGALLYPAGLTRSDQLVLGGLLVVLNAAVYAFVAVRRR